ncbi:hydroxypyruvate isomerase [Massilia glaciei]|uniref:Hydroxypyruvate isomerase n=1 Tax=Massilia glaciei TaxID=1524097 RepID=A0A2U2HLW6_9BURK|nr:hydroxypyruvate isomerase [Massilia glaciei]PWF48518.1 hydroxypyruvate isomerase [Massilia glaciei]
MPKFAANLSLLFKELPFLDRFEAAAEAGFEAVEFLFPYSFEAGHIARELARNKLELVLHNLPCGDWDAGDRGMACDPLRVAQFRDSVALALEYARGLGVERLHCMAGIVPSSADRETAHATYVSNLRYAAARLGEHGMRLLIEPINSFDMPGYFLTGSAQAAAVIAECGAGNLFMQYDIYHMQRMEGALAETIRAHLPLIAHMQLADAPGRHEPGTGGIDFPALLKLIDALGYNGWIGCEYIPLGATVEGLVWRQAVQQ